MIHGLHKHQIDLAYFDSSDKTWHVKSSASGIEIATTFGQSTDTPF